MKSAILAITAVLLMTVLAFADSFQPWDSTNSPSGVTTLTITTPTNDTISLPANAVITVVNGSGVVQTGVHIHVTPGAGETGQKKIVITRTDPERSGFPKDWHVHIAPGINSSGQTVPTGTWS